MLLTLYGVSMANRSKKVVISARITPYLKAAIDMAAAAQNEKIVTMMENLLEQGLNEIFVPTPFCDGVLREGAETNFMHIFGLIWSEDPILFKLRAGALGPDFAGEKNTREANVVISCEYFKGDYDLYGDVDNQFSDWGSFKKVFINFNLVKEEWSVIEGYISFLENNKNLLPTYESYKKMVESSGAR